jgi:hypothetical protein
VKDLAGTRFTGSDRCETRSTWGPPINPRPRPRTSGCSWGALAPVDGQAGLPEAAGPVARLLILQSTAAAAGDRGPRSDDRIDFIGGSAAELEKRCPGWAVAFALCPTSIQQLMSVADAGKVAARVWFSQMLVVSAAVTANA